MDTNVVTCRRCGAQIKAWPGWEKHLMHLDMRWLKPAEKRRLTKSLSRGFQVMGNARRVVTKDDARAFATRGLPDYRIVEDEETLVMVPNGRMSPEELAQTLKDRSSGGEFFLLYGEAPQPRGITLHRLEAWGFVALTSEGYRSFSWGKLHHVTPARSYNRTAFYRLELHKQGETLWAACQSCMTWSRA